MKTRTISLVAGAAGAAWLMMASAGALAQEAGALVGPDPIAAVIDARERSKMLEKAPLVGGLGGMRGETNAAGSGAVRSASTLAAAPTRDSREGSALGGEPSASGGRGGIDTGSMSSLLSMALPLGGVIVLLLGCMVILKRVMGTSSSLAAALGPGGRAPGGVLEVLGRYPVAKGQLLVLIKIDRRVLLVGHSSPGRGTGGIGGGFSTLCEITDPEEVAAVLRKVEDGEGKSAGARFGSLLQRKSGVSGGERAGGRAGDDMELGVHEVASSRGDACSGLKMAMSSRCGMKQARARRTCSLRLTMRREATHEARGRGVIRLVSRLTAHSRSGRTLSGASARSAMRAAARSR